MLVNNGRLGVKGGSVTERFARVARSLLPLLAVLSSGAAGAPPESKNADALRLLSARDSLTVVVTDSGLGGLSVVADAARKLTEQKAYRHVEIVFYNALFTDDGGYNSLPDRDDKVRVFNRALEDMQRRYAPDVILVACNTLSVLADATDFASASRTPVIGIVDAGVNLIADRLEASGRDRVIIFATETTVEEGTHKAALVSRGIDADRIVLQQCPELASYIEKDHDGMETRLLIDAYVDEALARAGKTDGALHVSFNCTHYGYALPAWRETFEARGVPVADFLNPNQTMIDVLLPDVARDRFDSVDVRVRAVSMVEIPEATRASIGGLLREDSPATARALQEYELNPDLFRWRDLVNGGNGR
jgi:glutamate racemase